MEEGRNTEKYEEEDEKEEEEKKKKKKKKKILSFIGNATDFYSCFHPTTFISIRCMPDFYQDIFSSLLRVYRLKLPR